jgi:hypothetical protein
MKSARMLGLVAAAVATIIGCSTNQGGTTAGKKPHGQVSVALTSTATDGTQYRLKNAYVAFLGQNGTYFSQYLDTTADHILVNLPVGTYNAYLYSTVTGGGWALDLIHADGTDAGPVDGVSLLTVLPVQITVAPNSTVPLVFTFRVPTGGTITFVYGTVDITVDVQKGVADWYSFDGDAISTVSYAQIGGPSASTIATVLPDVGVGFEATFSGSLVGSWFFSNGYSSGNTTYVRVCTAIDVSLQAPAGGAGVQDLLAEVMTGFNPSSGYLPLCISDDGTRNMLDLYLYRYGAPTTATFTALTSDDLFFSLELVGVLPARVFDYGTGVLDLGALMGDYELPASAAYVDLYDMTTSTSWYFGEANATYRFHLVGH